jgi:hypothetical protein
VNTRVKHTPFEQETPDAQAVPQDPQFAASLFVSAQNEVAPVPHFVSGAAQVALQTPAEQALPAAQAVPQAPQFS